MTDFISKYTEREKQEHVKNFIESKMSGRAYAKKHKLPRTTFRNWCKKYKHIGIDEARLAHQTIDGHYIKKATTHYDGEGNIKNIWLKTDKELEDTLAIIKSAVEGFKEQIEPIKPTEYKGVSAEKLLSLYVTTDYHYGMLANEIEVGEEWNLEIAEELLLKWYRAAIDAAPPSDVGIFCNLGDLLHFDSINPVTPTSGHIMDAAARFPLIVKSVIKLIKQIVQMMLQKHKHVHIIMAEGNHDISSSIWMRSLFSELYRDEPRITVDTTDTPYYCYVWGETSLFFHHGHMKNPNNVAELFAYVFREEYGSTKYSYAHLGDKHHRRVVETSMMEVIQHTTMTVRDAHSVRHGWGSKRSAMVVNYHKDFGEVSTNTISPYMVM